MVPRAAIFPAELTALRSVGLLLAIIEFPDYPSALAFYDDPEYRAVLPHALAASEREIVIVEGVED